MLLAECGQRRCRHPPHGQEELQLHLFALGGQIPQPHRIPKAGLRGYPAPPPPAVAARGPAFVEPLLGQQGGDVLCQRLALRVLEVDGLEQAVEQGAGTRPFREGEDGRGGRLLFLHGDGGLGGHLVVEAGVGQHPLPWPLPWAASPE